MKRFWRIFRWLAGLTLIAVLALVAVNEFVGARTSAKIQSSITEIPAEDPPRVAIVFGARVWDDKRPSNTLYDRVLTAVELYRAGRVKKLLMSGDRRDDDYDEPAAMKKLALELGVAEADIAIDNDGKRTLDTCVRARQLFDVQRAVLVTQDYHQPRALYLCAAAGIDGVGITANRRAYDGEWYYHFREFFSVANAWFEVNFLSAKKADGEKQPIGQ
ncbi:MAG: YdcF family protein [Acidobacteria bacterium]|nr:YdcF family protein [Acidobacteriota bacterium]